VLQFLRDLSQEVKTERKLNCSRAHRTCRKIYKTRNIQPMKKSGLKLDQSEKKLGGIQLRKLSEPWSARYRGAIINFTYVCGATDVHKQGTPDWRCITYVNGTLAL
jgi:hypothetical protein